MNSDLKQRFPHLGKLSIALLEHLVEPVIGKDAKDVIKAPAVEKELQESLGRALGYAEGRFTKEHTDAELCRALLDVPLHDLPSLKQAVRDFYDRPTDPTLTETIQQCLKRDYPQVALDRIESAVAGYLKILRQELVPISDDIRGKLGTLAVLGIKEDTAQIVELLKQSNQSPPTSESPTKTPSGETVATIPNPQPPSTNPFFTGGAVPPELFVGRASALTLIKTRLGGRSLQSVSVVGERRIGKSSLLRYVREKAADLLDTRPIVVYLDLMKGYCHTRAGFTKALRRELATALGREPWPAAEDADPSTLSFALEDLSKAGARIILCLDEVDELTKRRAEFDDLLEELRAAGQMGQIGLLTGSAHPLADLCRNDKLISPFFNIFIQEMLGLLDEAEWQSLVRSQMTVTDDELKGIERLAAGHPCYTQIAATRLWDAKHDGETDWEKLALADVKPHWAAQWEHLTPAEQIVLKDAAGFGGLAPDSRLIEPLRRRGLLKQDTYRPFSDAYSEWIAIATRN